MTKFEEIIKLLKDAKVQYELIAHEPALTSKQSEMITGWPIDSGAKAIVFKLDKEFILAVVRGDKRVDFNKLRKIYGVRKARLATPEEVHTVMGVKIGACYPFPSIAGIRGLADENLLKVKLISFSPGTAENHVRLKLSDYQKIAGVEFLDITKS